MTNGPALVSILRQGSYLIASVHTALDDTEMVRFQHDLIEQIGVHRSRGVVIDVGALDVLDSFGTRTLRTIAEMARLRGAVTVVVGIQPDVAFAMVQLGLTLEGVGTAWSMGTGSDARMRRGQWEAATMDRMIFSWVASAAVNSPTNRPSFMTQMRSHMPSSSCLARSVMRTKPMRCGK